MKDFIKNNIFISLVIGLMWVFFFCISIAESGFFIDHFMQALGTTIFLVVMSSFNTRQIQKIKKAKENINSEEPENIIINKKNTGKLNYKKASIVSLTFFGVLFGIAAVLTVGIFYIRKIELTMHDFFIGILVFSVCELIIGSIVVGIRAYIRECKQEGFLKTTLYVIFMSMIVVWLVISKNSRWF